MIAIIPIIIGSMSERMDSPTGPCVRRGLPLPGVCLAGWFMNAASL